MACYSPPNSRLEAMRTVLFLVFGQLVLSASTRMPCEPRHPLNFPERLQQNSMDSIIFTFVPVCIFSTFPFLILCWYRSEPVV